MYTTRHNNRQYLTGTLMGIFALAFVCSATSTFAQSAVEFGIGESARLLEAAIELERGEISQAEFNAIKMAETCKDPATRLMNRNRPWMYVWNKSTNPDDVDEVTIDLTEPGFEFGDGDVAGDGFGGLLSMLSYRSDSGVSLTSASYGADNTELVLDFTGLSDGLAAIFRIDLDEPGGATMYPDFREAMLGADTGSGPGQLATLTTEFSSGLSTVSSFLEAGTLNTSGIAEGYHSQTMSMVEKTPTEVIPEPTTLVLLLAGVGGIAAMRRYH